MNGDPEAISNHSLHAKLMVLETKFEAHGAQLNDHIALAGSFRDEATASLRDISVQLGAGQIRFALLETGIGGNTKTLGDIETKLDTLIAEENRRKGRDGFIKGILNSKALAWIIAAAGAAWAVITGTGHGGGT